MPLVFRELAAQIAHMRPGYFMIWGAFALWAAMAIYGAGFSQTAFIVSLWPFAIACKFTHKLANH